MSLDKEMLASLKRMVARQKARETDPTRGDEMRGLAEDMWVTRDGIECFTRFNAFPGWELLPDSTKKFIQHGMYCGYVRLVRPLFRTKQYGGLLSYVPVHGGITYTAVDSEGCKIYGFDTGHAGDEDKPWSREATMRETARLALGLVVAARFEDAFLRRAKPGRGKSRKWRARRRRKQWSARARIIDRYQRALRWQAGIRFDLRDQFIAMLNVVFGTL